MRNLQTQTFQTEILYFCRFAKLLFQPRIMAKNVKKKRNFFHKLHDKYRLVIMNDETFEEKLSFRLTRFNVFIFFGTLSIFLVIATTYLIAFTPLREYIPGYADFNTRKILRELMLKTDSLEVELRQKDLYFQNIRNIVEGRDVDEFYTDTVMSQEHFEIDELTRSREDSILRAEMEAMGSYNEWVTEEVTPTPTTMTQSFFFPPVQGIITSYFDPSANHYGVDIVADKNEAIKATLDGTVIFSHWTLETGYNIGLQHGNNLVSVYKHNSVLLKKEGDFVRAGEVIAIIGDSGLYSTGTHLHFELWHNGVPVNPLDYIVF